jgi:hypothetical protein
MLGRPAALSAEVKDHRSQVASHRLGEQPPAHRRDRLALAGVKLGPIMALERVLADRRVERGRDHLLAHHLGVGLDAIAQLWSRDVGRVADQAPRRVGRVRQRRGLSGSLTWRTAAAIDFLRFHRKKIRAGMAAHKSATKKGRWWTNPATLSFPRPKGVKGG